MIRVVAYLFDNQTGEYDSHEYEAKDDYAEACVYMWEDGNYACDCNRLIFMGHDFDDVECSNGRVTCLLLTIDGVEVYAERQV